MCRKITILLFLLGILMSVNAQQRSNDQRTRETKIADIVMQLPAKNSESLNNLMKELAEIGDAIPDLATRLMPPGQGDDSQLRYAIGGLAFYTSKNNILNYRQQTEAGICKSLSLVQSDEVKDFLLIQLQYVAGPESVNTVKGYLTNDRLCDPAARVLVRINNEEANKALLDALSNANSNRQPTLVEALGYTKYLPALDAVTALLNKGDEKMQKTVLFTLANIASPSSNKDLATTIDSKDQTYNVYITYLKNLNNNGQKDLAAKYSKELIKKLETPQQTAAKSAALEIYSQSAGEKAISEIINALKSDDKKYRMAALFHSMNINSPKMSEALLKKAKGANSEVKSEIIQMMGARNDKSSLSFVLESLKNKDPEVVIAAMGTAAYLGQQEAIIPIIKAMNTDNQDIVSSGKTALLTINSPQVLPEVANLIHQASPLAQAAMLDIIGQKQATPYSKIVFDYSVNEDKNLRDAAYKAMKNVVTEKDLQTLAFQLTFPAGQNNIPAVQDALYAAVKKSGDQGKQTQLILNEMNKADNKSLYYRTLSMIGGEKALSIVSEGFQSSNPEIKTLAFDALCNWNGFEAASELYTIAEKNMGSAYFDKALMSYSEKVSTSGNTDAQKLLLLRNALEIAKTPAQQKDIISKIALTKTFLGLITVGEYLNNSDSGVQQAAVQAIFRLALSGNDYSGETVTGLLNQAIAINKDPEADYQKQAILKYMAALPKGDGWQSMFNGKDLTGWKGLVENPIARGKMKSAQLATKQKAADEIMRRDWKVENGLLVFEGAGYDNLCSEKMYGDFELYVDWRIAPKGDAGIYLRGTPQVQIWDTALTEVGAEVGSGGLYNNQKHPSKPLVVADNPVNEWNSFFIRMIGEKVTVYLNGQLVVDNITLENYWDRKLPIFPMDALELQAHGTRVEYRDIYVREIPRAKAYEVSAEEKKEGFAPMFNGIDMSGWVGNLTDYVAKDGMIVCDPTHGGRGNLYTEKEYSDFIMRFDFQLTPAANNGLGIRTPLEGDAAYVGMELQILDNEADVYKDLEEYQYHGSVYGVIAAKRGHLKPLGEWNTQEVIANGNHIKITLNGVVILDGDIAKASNNFTAPLDGKNHPGLSNKKGHIGFLGHGSEVAFRNLRIKVLK